MPSKRLKIIKRIDWKKLNVHDDINEIARMIVVDIGEGIKKGLDINNSPFEPLKSSTIASKGNSKILVDKDIMRKIDIQMVITLLKKV